MGCISFRVATFLQVLDTYTVTVAVTLLVVVTGFSMQLQILAAAAFAAEDKELRAEDCTFPTGSQRISISREPRRVRLTRGSTESRRSL